MGNRAVITTRKDLDENGIGLYMHWNGGYDSVRPILDYCRIRGFRSPDKDCYGYARLAQIVCNFMGGDGYSVGVGRLKELDTNNGDNGTYVIEDWKVAERLHYSGEEQNEYDYNEFIMNLDECQPEDQRLGGKMIRGLLKYGKTLPEVSFQYHFSIERMFGLRIDVKGFQTGQSYAVFGAGVCDDMEIVENSEDTMKVRFQGNIQEGPKYFWRDGRESFVVECDNGKTGIADSMTPAKRFRDGIRFNHPRIGHGLTSLSSRLTAFGSSPPGLIQRPVPKHLPAVLRSQ